MKPPALTWVSPLPPIRSGVADYAFEILPKLAPLVRLRIVKPPGWEGAIPAWGEEARWVDANVPPEGVQLLHLGNNPYHLWVVQRLRRHGGIVVLHDAVVHHLLVEEAANDENWERFAADLHFAHGAWGKAIAWARRWGFSGPLDPFLLPARRAYLRFARGVLVHSRWALERVREDLPELPVRQVPLAVAALPGEGGEEVRRQLKMAEGELLAVHLGFLTPAKGLWEIFKALVILRELNLRVKLLVVGEGVEANRLRAAVRDLKLEGLVQFAGFVSRERLGAFLAASDLGLVPRYPTAGETSAVALRFFAAGRPVIVCGYQQFLELPQKVAFRIRPGEEGVLDIVRWLAFLAAHPQVLEEKKQEAKRAWEAGSHAPGKAAQALVEALDSLVDVEEGQD